MMSAPAWYSASASSLPLVGSLNAAPVLPAYFTITTAFGLTALTPAMKPAWNLRMSGISMPPTKPSLPVFVGAALLLAELERDEVGRDRVGGVHGVIDARELLVRELLRQRLHVVGEQE